MGLIAVLAACGEPPIESSASNVTQQEITFVNFDDHPGYADIYEGRGFRNGIPLESLEVAKALGGVVEGIFHEDRVSTDTPEGAFRAFGALPSPPNRDSPELPLGRSVFERDKAWYENGNCLACHAGVVAGQVVAGLGNAHLDQASGLVKALALFKIDKTLRAKTRLFESDAEYEELRTYLRNIEVTVKETFKFANTRGDNMGPYAVWRRLSRLADPSTLGLSEIEADEVGPYDELFASQHLGTVDPNPWWNRKYRSVQYWFAEGAPDVASHFAFNFTIPHAGANEHHAEHVAAIARILELAARTHSPAYPRALDGELVARGHRVFHSEAGCASCHGSYDKYAGDLGEAGGWIVHYQDSGLIDVGTDARYSETLRAFQPIAEYGNALEDYFDDLAPQTNAVERAGYIAPPLVGAWASAPYFHNGSVPTLWHVLDPNSRPDYWERSNDDPFAYDWQRTGLAYRERSLTADEYGAEAERIGELDPLSPEAVDFRALYATSRIGKSNAGHDFGGQLSDADRHAVIEFLKALSGPDMPPAQ